MRVLVVTSVLLTACVNATLSMDPPPESDPDSGKADGTGTEPSDGDLDPACVGTTVPGDYATLQQAIDGLAATGSDQTLCLNESEYVIGTAYVRDVQRHSKTLTIVGRSMDETTLQGSLLLGGGWEHVVIERVTVNAGVSGTAIQTDGPSVNGPGTPLLEVRASRLVGYIGLSASGADSVTIDGCEIATTGFGVNLFGEFTGPLVVDVLDSYLHGGTAIRSTTAGQPIEMRAINNTILDSRRGIDLAGQTTAVIANNILSRLTETALMWTASTDVVHHHNALWGNAHSFDGSAGPGAGDVRADCVLDLASVPAPAAASACRDAGDATVAPAHDYYGHPRGTAPDLGAIELP